MTSYEHAMLGAGGALACGLHRRHGWQIAALAGVAAMGPDWDGLTLIVSRSVFAEGHRLWGHNLLACLLLGGVMGAVDYRFDVVTRLGRLLARLFGVKTPEAQLTIRHAFTRGGLCVWVLVASLAALSHLPADMLVSGTSTLADWELKPFWPVSAEGYVYAMVPWGDPGITLVFVAGMFATARRTQHIQRTAAITLAGVALYIALRGSVC